MTTIIYESPDKGNTIYAREFGEKNRTLIQGGGGGGGGTYTVQGGGGGGGTGKIIGDFHTVVSLGHKYSDILKTAETNPALKKAVEDMELIYGLTKKY